MTKNKQLYSVIAILAMTLIVLFFALKDDFVKKINYLFSFNVWWLLLAIVLVFIYWVLKSLVIYYCARKFDKDFSFKKAFYMIIGTQFFNAVTPFSTGGQPYQVYKLNKYGFPLEKGTNIIIQDFIVYQIALIVLASIAVITNNIFDIFPNNNLLKHLVLLGYIINVTVIIVLFVLAFNKKGNRAILNFIIKIGAKLKIIKQKEEFLEKTNTFINDFHINAKLLMESKFHFVKIIFINFIALILLYLVPFALIIGLGEYLDPFIVITSSAYVMLIGSFVPIPGGSGGLEFGFINFFGCFITGAKLSSIMIAWRFITYYLGLVVGAFFAFKGDD